MGHAVGWPLRACAITSPLIRFFCVSKVREARVAEESVSSGVDMGSMEAASRWKRRCARRKG